MSTVSMAIVPLRDEIFAANRAIGRIALTVAAGAGKPAGVRA